MSALAAIVTPGGADTAALLEPAIQLVAALASDLAAAVEFTAGGGVLGLLAILSDSSVKVELPALGRSFLFCHEVGCWLLLNLKDPVSRLTSRQKIAPLIQYASSGTSGCRGKRREVGRLLKVQAKCLEWSTCLHAGVSVNACGNSAGRPSKLPACEGRHLGCRWRLSAVAYCGNSLTPSAER